MHRALLSPAFCLRLARPRRVWISTLVPERLRPTDLLDLSGLKKASCAVENSSKPPSSLVYTSSYDAQKRKTRIPFPSNTRGFLYCHVPDPDHPAATEVRFRLTPEVTDDPRTAFELGDDLLLSSETPWRIQAISIARSRGTYESLATLLLRDGLASQEVMTHWAQAKQDLRLDRQTPVLCRLDQPFVYRLDSRELRLYVADTLNLRSVALSSALGDHRGSRGASCGKPIYSGDVLCRFESGITKGGIAVAHIRVLKALSPITPVDPSYDGYIPPPTVGDLLRDSVGEPAQVKTTGGQSALAILLRRVPDPGYISPLIDVPGRKEPRTISNLDPANLDPADFQDLSGKKHAQVHMLGRRRLQLSYFHGASALYTPYPPGTHGFLYTADDSSVRFRVAKDANPASFSSGWDLLRPDGRPWVVRPTWLAKVLV